MKRGQIFFKKLLKYQDSRLKFHKLLQDLPKFLQNRLQIYYFIRYLKKAKSFYS